MKEYIKGSTPLNRKVKDPYFKTLKSKAHRARSLERMDIPFLREYKYSIKSKDRRSSFNLKDDSIYAFSLKTIMMFNTNIWHTAK